MVFPTSGINHYEGIKNEHQIVQFLNSNKENSINSKLIQPEEEIKWLHQGGTQTKNDAIAELTNTITGEKRNEGVSIKNHKNGTFDWLNTSKLPPCLSNAKTLLNEVKEKYLLDNKIPAVLDEPAVVAEPAVFAEPAEPAVPSIIRKKVEDILNTQIDNMSSSDIKKIFEELYEIYPNWILINDCKKKELVFLNKENNLKYFINQPEYILKKTRAKTSRQILIKNVDGTEINTNIRIRFLLNNGVGTLLGLSKKNKCSIPCIKIQEDKVIKFISDCVNKTICPY